MARPKVQVLLDDKNLGPQLRESLNNLQAEISVLPFRQSPSDFELAPSDARLVLTHDARSMTNGKLNRLLAWFDGDPCATLVASDLPMTDEVGTRALLAERAICFTASASVVELTGHLSAYCGLHRSMDVLRTELLELRRRDEELLAGLQAFREELQLAGRIQRSLLESALPTLRGATIQTFHRPAEEVSGDVFHVTRLDERRVAIAVADATGHGFAAGLLSAFVQRSLRPPRASDVASYWMNPGEVLSRVNHELLAANLRECHFVTAVYAVYNEETHVIEWARAGAPYPLLARSKRATETLASEGILLGVRQDAVYPVRRHSLARGESFVLYTDGLDNSALIEKSNNIDTVTQHLREAVSTISPVDDATAVLLHVE